MTDRGRGSHAVAVFGFLAVAVLFLGAAVNRGSWIGLAPGGLLLMLAVTVLFERRMAGYSLWRSQSKALGERFEGTVGDGPITIDSGRFERVVRLATLRGFAAGRRVAVLLETPETVAIVPRNASGMCRSPAPAVSGRRGRRRGPPRRSICSSSSSQDVGLADGKQTSERRRPFR